MKSTLLLVAALLTAPFVTAAQGPLKEKALAIATAQRDSVLYLSAVVELEVTVGDNPAKKEERKVEMIGTVIGADGLIVVPLSTLDIASAIDGRMVNTQQGQVKLAAKGTTKEVKILLPDGSEVEAKVSFKDPDLDLAFIRPTKADSVKLVPVKIDDSAPMALLDEVIVLTRLGKDLNREPVVMTSEVISLITQPRTYGKLTVQTLGTPVFNMDGKFVGLGVNRFSAKGDAENQGGNPANVILPAADLKESAAQAK